MHETRLQLVPKNGQPGWITLADIPDRGTTFIMQRYLLTHIETQIDRDEGMALASALLQHFDAPAPMTIPHGHGPVGGFYAQLDEARAQDHTHISLSRGHANLLAEHIRLLEEQLAALQSRKPEPLPETLMAVYKDKNQPYHVKRAAMDLIQALQPGVPDECAATGQSCEYAPDGRNGEMQCKYCGKSEKDKYADV
ncbi:TPA: hypothetical protein R5O69_004394 [Enterobacter hormaechei]|nr:hypothetical protein [Enterobacter hormaechei]HED5802424.1 hypothetical protein [Enterobacter hormaechei]HED5821851.1 hypothetical protein [Enterobacter hormaechei]